ncbi:MAG: fused MFS/spermidine synthase [Chthoniobacterales bacterium]
MPVILLAVALFLSGVSALIFETLWLQLSGLVFGNSVWAAALILSSFMAGLALGNALATTRIWRRVRPIYAYALLELVVAVSGCIVVLVLPQLGHALRPMFQLLWQHQSNLLALRFLLSLLVLLVPTTAMGLTLAILLGDESLRRYQFGAALGWFYGANTLGAVVGAILTEWCLIRAFGLIGTGIVAALTNVAAALIAWQIGRRSREQPADVDRRWKVGPVLRGSWRWLLIGFGSGLLLLALEVIWFRFLRLYVASSTIAFATMLAVVLAGIGIGGMISGVMQRRVRDSRAVIQILLLLAGIATLACYIWFPASAARAAEERFDLDRWPQITLISMALMFPVSCLSGIMFPAVSAVIQGVASERSASVGLTTFANTLGAAIGPLLATFVLLPVVGFQTGLIICSVGYGLLGAVAFSRSYALVSLGLVVAMAGLLVTFPYRRAEDHLAHARELYAPEGSRLVKEVNGTADTLQLLRRDLYGEPYYYRLLTNSFSMSATSPAGQRYMRLFAYLPLMLNPDAKRALLICYGCGVTADALVRATQLQHVDSVDISKEVYDLADDYRAADYINPLNSPKLTRYVQDGRFYLQATPQLYDIITGEPPPLKVVGAVNLYTTEFFSLMRSRLNAGGIASFWLPIYQLRPDETKAILRAFHEAFPNSSLWSGTEDEWVMIGVNGEPRSLSREDLGRLWSDGATRHDLVRVGFETPAEVAASFLMDGDEIESYTAGTPPLADIFPRRLTDARADDSVTYRFAWKYIEAAPALRRFSSSAAMQAIWSEFSNEELRPFFELRAANFLSRIIGSNKLADLDFYLRNTQLRSPVLAALGSDEFRVAIAARAGTIQAVPDLVAAALAGRDPNRALAWLQKKPESQLTSEELSLLVYLCCLSGQVRNAEEIASRHLAAFPKNESSAWLWTKLQNDFGFRPPG